VVHDDVSPFAIVGGVPARHLAWRFEGAAREAHQKVIDRDLAVLAAATAKRPRT
jgi:hypothetical protein